MSAARRRRPVAFYPAASEELSAAVVWYDREQKGLGDEFLREVKRAVRRVADHPEAWNPPHPDSRPGNRASASQARILEKSRAEMKPPLAP